MNMNYKPSRNFLLSIGLLTLSFFIMQGVVIPSIAETEMQAAVLKANQTRPALISGIFRKSAWEEFDEKAKTIRETNVSYYIEKVDGKTTKLNPKARVDESLLDQYVDYDPLTKTITPSLNVKGISRADEKPEKGDGGSGDEPEKIDSVVFLVQFADSTPVNMTASEYQSRLFGLFGWIKKFYGDVTHGDIVMQGDVYGWYPFPEPSTGSCALVGENIQDIADFYGIDISDYEMIITITNCESYNNLGGVYIGETGSSSSFGHKWVRISGYHDRLLIGNTYSYAEDWPGLVWNMIHELGHSFDMEHAQSYDCNDITLEWSSSCVIHNYGNPFDVMGNWSGRIFNFYSQLSGGFIADDNILDIYGPGEYFINNLQTENGVVAARIYPPQFSTPVFAVEHRKRVGFDSNLPSNIQNGLLLYSKQLWVGAPPGYSWWSTNTWYNIIDPHPTDLLFPQDIENDSIRPAENLSGEFFLDRSFYDDIFGIGIQVTEVTDSGIYFTATYDYENSICGQWIEAILSIPLCEVPPSGEAVENFLATMISPSEFQLSWTNLLEDEGVTFTILRTLGPNGGVSLVDSLPVSTNGYLATDLPPGNWRFKLRAVKNGQHSEWSITP